MRAGPSTELQQRTSGERLCPNAAQVHVLQFAVPDADRKGPSPPKECTPMFLTDTEIGEICSPLVMPAAQRRYLERLGLVVKMKPNGRPLVARGECERVMIGGQTPAVPGSSASEPNRAALFEVLQGGRRRGTQAQGR